MKRKPAAKDASEEDEVPAPPGEGFGKLSRPAFFALAAFNVGVVLTLLFLAFFGGPGGKSLMLHAAWVGTRAVIVGLFTAGATYLVSQKYRL